MHARAMLALVTAAIAAGCGATDHARHAGQQAPPADAREAVAFPEPMRTHTLANMRDHLHALQEIQQALAEGAHDRAAEVAERRLGMTAMRAHGAHDVAKFMPEGMQAIGTGMHRSASRFAVAAADAGASGDVKPALAALAQVTQQCVACHASYRMK
jgi:cytochrome c556